MAKIRKPKKIVAKKYGKFIHEIITPREEIPEKAKFRTIKMDAHRVSIAYWGKPVAGKHPFYVLHKILHPKKKGEPCKLKDRLKLMGIKELVLGREYEVVSKLPKLTGKRRAGKLITKNPKPIKIYDKILSIEAQKGDSSLFPKQYFRHDFKKDKTHAEIWGLPDGSLLIKSKKGKKLWKNFDY
jgi:hypothetical protein